MNEKNQTPRRTNCRTGCRVDPKSPYYNEAVLARDVGIRFKGVEKNNVEEYCVSEGWIRVTAGNAKDRYGNPLDDQGAWTGRTVFPRQAADVTGFCPSQLPPTRPAFGRCLPARFAGEGSKRAFTPAACRAAGGPRP